MAQQKELFPGIKTGKSKKHKKALKPDMSGLKSGLQKSVRRGDLQLLRLCFHRLWELDRRWVLWRLPIICAEESEWFTFVYAIFCGKNMVVNATWKADSR